MKSVWVNGMFGHIRRIGGWLRHSSPRRRLLVRFGAVAMVMILSLWLIAWGQRKSRDQAAATAQSAGAGVSGADELAPDSPTKPAQASVRAPQPIPSGEPAGTATTLSSGQHRTEESPPPITPPVPPPPARWAISDASDTTDSTSSSQLSPTAASPPSTTPPKADPGSLTAVDANVQLLPPPVPPAFGGDGSAPSVQAATNELPLPSAPSRFSSPAETASTATGSSVVKPPTNAIPGAPSSTGIPKTSASEPAEDKATTDDTATASSPPVPPDPAGSIATGHNSQQSLPARHQANDRPTTERAEQPENLRAFGQANISANAALNSSSTEGGPTEQEPPETRDHPPLAIERAPGAPRGGQPVTTMPTGERAPAEDTLPASTPGLAADGQADHSAVETAPRIAIPPAAFSSDKRGSAPLSQPNPFSDTHDAPAVPGASDLAAQEQAAAVAPVPAPPSLEGAVSPTLTVEKIAPEEVQVGRQATFSLRVKNTGKVPAHQVTISDAVPRGAKLVATVPPAQVRDGLLSWQVGHIAPGEEITVSYRIIPEIEGEIGSVAQVTFAAQASARAISTRPVLKLEVTGPRQVLIHDTVRLALLLRNEGTGPAHDVVVEEDVPAELSHPAGRELENAIGTLRPGESRRFELELSADKAGRAINRIRVRDDQTEHLVEETPIEVIAPALRLHLRGPALRYLERKATYQVTLENAGSAAAENVDLVVFLPPGLKFLAADKLGRYSPQHHAVYWNLVELPPGQAGTVQLSTMAIEPGEQRLRVEARGQRDATATAEQTIRVESAAELHFTVVDQTDPIEVGSETVYELELVNRGTRADTNIVVTADFSPELQPLGTEGEIGGNVSAQRIIFPPLPQLAPGQRVTLRLRAIGRKAGMAVVRVEVRSDQMPTAVAKEEASRVYSE